MEEGRFLALINFILARQFHQVLFFIEVCVIYFRLKSLDLEFMKRLDKCVNIIPVIAKSDTLTLEEREAFKRRVSVHDTHKLYNLYNRN